MQGVAVENLASGVDKAIQVATQVVVGEWEEAVKGIAVIAHGIVPGGAGIVGQALK